MIEPHFVRNGCAGRFASGTFTSVFCDRTSFRAKGLRPDAWNRNFTSFFLRSDRLFRCERVVFRAVSLALPRVFKRDIEKKERASKRARENVKMWRCEDVKMWGCEDVLKRRSEDVKMWRWEDVKMRRCEDVKMWGCEDVKMRRCEDEKMWRWERCEDEKMSRCEDEKMWRCEGEKMRRCEDVKMRRWEDVKMWGCEDEKMWRCEDVNMRRCEDVRMWRWEDVKMWGCEDEKMWRCENGWQTPTIRRTLRSDALGKRHRRPQLVAVKHVEGECDEIVQWSLGSNEYVPACQLDTMISGLVRMWLHDLLRHMPMHCTQWSLG